MVTAKSSAKNLPDDPQTLAQNLYKQNLELAVRNKTLSLLSKLYELSILTLAPKDIAGRVSEAVQTELSFELVGILLYDKEHNSFFPLAFASSPRLQKIQKEFGIRFEAININASKNPFWKKITETKKLGYSEKLEEVWDSLIQEKMFAKIISEGHVRSTMIHPLLIQNEIIGALILSLNRLKNDLVEYEQDSISSFVNVVAVALDKAIVSEKLKAANEQLKILDAARAEFITMASHQLRTPPSSIKWFLSGMLANEFGKVGGDLRDAMRKLEATNNSQISLIDALLNVSRIERGKLEFVFEDTDLAELAAFTVDQLEPLAVQKKLKLSYIPPKTAPPKIIMDKEKIHQVISNMIDNAIKYSKQGEIKVMLEAASNDLIVKVQDTGKGMSKDELKCAFEKYGRGADSKKFAAGLGLGMYLGKVIVEQHNGKIWAESPGAGKGSVFAFSLPIKNKIKPTSLVFDLTKTQKVK